MRRIIRTLLLFAVIMASLSASAQKVVERSAKKAPQWVGSVTDGYIVASSTGKTIDEAQQKSMRMVLVHMLEAVAQNVESSTETTIEQKTHGQDVSSDIYFKQVGKSSVANLPCLKGMGISKAKDFYWERIEDKSTGELYYSYSLLYPFTASDEQQLKEEFDKLDADMVAIVDNAEKQLPDIQSVNALEKGIADQEYARDYFFDAVRKNRAEHLIESYKSTLKQLTLNSRRLARCQYELWVEKEGKVLTCSTIPSCKSKTATKIQCRPSNGKFLLTFSDEECIPDDENKITVQLRLKYNTIRYDLFF